MDKQLWPGWKVALFSFLGLFAVTMIIAGIYAVTNPDLDPEKAGNKAGRLMAPFILGFPIVAYIIQKVRIDSARAKARAKEQAERREIV